MSGDTNTPNPSPGSPRPEKEKSKSPEEHLAEKVIEIAGKQAKLVVEKREISMRSGPLPDPAELDAYNKIIPNGADRILKMAENQAAHRIEIEKIVIGSQQKQASRGQIFGLTIGIFGLGSATYAAINGQAWFGSVIGGATLVSLVLAFLNARQKQQVELEQKRKLMSRVLE